MLSAAVCVDADAARGVEHARARRVDAEARQELGLGRDVRRRDAEAAPAARAAHDGARDLDRPAEQQRRALDAALEHELAHLGRRADQAVDRHGRHDRDAEAEARAQRRAAARACRAGSRPKLKS